MKLGNAFGSEAVSRVSLEGVLEGVLEGTLLESLEDVPPMDVADGCHRLRCSQRRIKQASAAERPIHPTWMFDAIDERSTSDRRAFDERSMSDREKKKLGCKDFYLLFHFCI